MSFISIVLIKFYQRVISPFLPNSCRFYPSCSNYSIEAFQEHGFFKALYLTVNRVLRCNPYCKCGYDPVPSKHSCSQNLKTANKF